MSWQSFCSHFILPPKYRNRWLWMPGFLAFCSPFHSLGNCCMTSIVFLSWLWKIWVYFRFPAVLKLSDKGRKQNWLLCVPITWAFVINLLKMLKMVIGCVQFPDRKLGLKMPEISGQRANWNILSGLSWARTRVQVCWSHKQRQQSEFNNRNMSWTTVTAHTWFR